MPTNSPQRKSAKIADDLRQEISAGAIGVGMPLPSESELKERFKTSRTTVRDAIAQLQAEGIVYTIKGRGSFIRPKPPARRLAMSRYRADVESTAERPQSSFTHDHGIPWSEHRPDVAIVEVTADREVADLFDVPGGTPLLRRDLVFRVAGYPMQMSTSYYLLDMVAGTWVAGPESEPAPGGAIGHLATLGVRVTRVREQVVSRMPTEREAQVLRIGAGPVLAITRQMLAGDRVVEVAREIVIPGENVVLEYEIDL